ncbi:unnamed protein product [Parascedosporium putredinis]|uniref:Glucanase n=1 Tax=Parascedosporium putredinis TaxID=1442378 RepID=A0A9P1MG71_9PEZI|nr:unnamed protein product [Parascedosporium putredinis]CAI8003900.1 unnamed protein product [Parascedosporium putredinis]
MKGTIASGLALLAATVSAQQVGSEESETHPKLSWQKCSAPGSCSNVNGEIVIDANWRWIHTVDGYDNCYDGNVWTDICSDASDCAKNCAVEGADYSTTYGITTSSDALTLKFVQEHEYGANVGSRVYLMNGSDKYQMFELLNNEFAFDVDLSQVECGMNSALYFVPMKEDGGLSDESNNEAGAKYGVGYCDAQCARDLKFINGKDDTCGGTYSDDRYSGGCDANGCDYNPYRLGNLDFYGQGSLLDTTKNVITRFEQDAMYQVFIQDGKTIEVPAPNMEGIPSDSNKINAAFCTAAPTVFDDRNRFDEIGGYSQLTEALAIPMVLVMSIWSDKAGQPGALRGPCATDSGVPAEVIAEHGDATVVWSNIRYGPIGSTHEV